MPDGYKRSVAAWFARLGNGQRPFPRWDWGWWGAASGAGHPAHRRVPRHPVPPVRAPLGAGPGTLVAAASWLPGAGRGDPGGDLGAILRGYRHAG